MVQDRRLELPRPKIGHKILSLARLPIPPILQVTFIYYQYIIALSNFYKTFDKNSLLISSFGFWDFFLHNLLFYLKIAFKIPFHFLIFK